MYLFTFSLFSLFAIKDVIEQRKRKNMIIFIFFFFWLVFHDGFRWETGTDWKAYTLYYRDCLSLDWSYFEIGYSTINILVRSISDEYTIFLIFFAIVFYLFVLSSIYRYSSFPMVTLLLFYCMMLTFMGANRQLLSLVICLYSIRYVLEKRIYKFLLLIMLAFCFHRTALFFVGVYFFTSTLKTNKYIVILLLCLVFPLFNIIQNIPIVNIIAVFGNTIFSEKIDFYYSGEYGLEYVNPLISFVSILRKLFFLIIALVYMKTLKSKSEYFPIFFNMYFISNVIFVLFNNTPLQILVSRLNLYFNLAECFLIPMFFYLFRDKRSQVVFQLLVMFYSFILMQKSISNYDLPGFQNLLEPYKGIFINSDYYREMW